MYREDVLKRTCKHRITENGLSVYEYSPSLSHLLAVPLEPLSIARRFRFLSEIIHGGYSVYYLVKDEIVVGYCVVTSGGRRLKCSSIEDGVIGPLYICPKFRGKGLSKILINQVLNCCSQKYISLFCWICENNIPSRHSFEACGFKQVGRLDVVGYLRRLIINSDGADIIYKKDNQY